MLRMEMLQSDWTAAAGQHHTSTGFIEIKEQTEGLRQEVCLCGCMWGDRWGRGQTETGWDPDQSVCFLTEQVDSQQTVLLLVPVESLLETLYWTSETLWTFWTSCSCLCSSFADSSSSSGSSDSEQSQDCTAGGGRVGGGVRMCDVKV